MVVPNSFFFFFFTNSDLTQSFPLPLCLVSTGRSTIIRLVSDFLTRESLLSMYITMGALSLNILFNATFLSKLFCLHFFRGSEGGENC